MTDQPARPAVLPDGRAVLAWVDRFGEQPAIRAAVAPSLEGEFSAPVTVYDHTAALASTQQDSPEDRTVSDPASPALQLINCQSCPMA